MKKHILFLFFVSLYSASFAQQQRLRVAIFTPLYLDSAFTSSGNLTTGKQFPKFVTAGLDFYLGAQAALDSLKKRNAPLEVFVYDIKSRNVYHRLQQLPKFDLAIGHTSLPETRMLADWAAHRKTPFISATLPNDAGIQNNPYFVVLNSTLEAHIEAIGQFLTRQYGNQKITVFTRPGAQEDYVKKNLQAAIAASGRTLNLRFVSIGNDFTTTTLASHLDSTQKNILVAGSLQTAFNQKLLQHLSTLNKDYPIAIVGMPTLENVNLSRLSPNLEVYYSTPFNYGRGSALETSITADYLQATGTRPGDLYFRGYETMLRFGLLLLDTQHRMDSALTRKGNTVFTSFNIQPVNKDGKDPSPDYFENKYLYIIRSMGGGKSVVY